MNTKLANTGLVLLLTAAAFAAVPTASASHPIVEPILEIAGAGEHCSNQAGCAAGPIVEPILEIAAIPDTCIRDPNACEGRPIVEPILELAAKPDTCIRDPNACEGRPLGGPGKELTSTGAATANHARFAAATLNCMASHLTEAEMEACWERFCRQYPAHCARGKPIVEPILELNSQAGNTAGGPAGAPCAPPDCTDPNNPIPVGALMALLNNYDVAGLEKVLGLVSPPARCTPGGTCVPL